MKLFQPILPSWIVLLSLAACSLSAVHGKDQRAPVYPFDVTINGQKAEVTETNPEEALFAKVRDPVPPDALLEVEPTDSNTLIIINAYPVNEDGVVPTDAQQAIKVIMGQQGESSVRLNATMDAEPLSPGRYGLNIVSGGETSRVMIVVQ